MLVNLINPLTAPGFALPGSHETTILTAQGGETHPGLTLTAFNTAVIHYFLSYPGTQNIDLNYAINYAPAGMTQNQTSVGNAVNAIQTAQLSPAFRPIATNLFYLPNVATLAAAYDSLSGEGVSASEQTAIGATDYFLSTVNTQMQRWLSDVCADDTTSKTVYEAPFASLPTRKREAPPPIPACAYARTWRIWGTGFGGGSHWLGDAVVGSAEVDQHTWGFAGGLDYQLTPNALLGVAVSGGASGFGVADRSTSGTVDAFHGALYGALRNQGFYASGVLSYDQFNNSETRTAFIPGVVLPASNFIDGSYLVPGFYERPNASFGAHSLSGYGEVGYQAKYGVVTATPFAGLEFSSLKTGAFAENNQGLPSVIGLSFNARTSTSFPSYLGLQLETKSDLRNQMSFDIWARGAWMHEFDASRGPPGLVPLRSRVRLRGAGRAAAAGRVHNKHRAQIEPDEERRHLRDVRRAVRLGSDIGRRDRGHRRHLVTAALRFLHGDRSTRPHHAPTRVIWCRVSKKDGRKKRGRLVLPRAGFIRGAEREPDHGLKGCLAESR